MIRKEARLDDKTGVKVTFVELLERSGVITKEALKNALAEQWERGGTLEEILVEKGFLNEEQLVKFILDSFPMLHYVSLKDIDIDPEAVEHIPARIARRYLVIPLRKKGKSLAVAMANPINREMLAELKSVTDLKIRPFISKVSEIKEAIERFYAETEPAEKITEPFAGGKIKREIGVFIAKDKTFDNFVVDETNRHAFLLCKDIAETRGVGEKKIFLYGPDGSGKSHLLQSIANYILENEALRRFVYIDAYKFYSSLKEFKTEREVYRYLEMLSDVDMLLFDDLDFLVGKDFAQDALLTVLSDLISRDKQVVITAAFPLKNLPTLNRKLRQVLMEFMAIDIEEPSADLKRKVARIFVGEEGLSSSVIDQIANRPGLNLKKIETIVRELLTYKRLGERIDENLLNKVIDAFIEAGK